MNFKQNFSSFLKIAVLYGAQDPLFKSSECECVCLWINCIGLMQPSFWRFAEDNYTWFYFSLGGSGPCGPGKNIQWIANPTTQPVHPSSRPRMYQGPGTVINALYQVGPEPLPAQRDALSLIIVAGIVPSYGQGTRQSHFRNDPMKYDLKVHQIFTRTTNTYWWFTRKPENIFLLCKLKNIVIILTNIYLLD